MRKILIILLMLTGSLARAQQKRTGFYVGGEAGAGTSWLSKSNIYLRTGLTQHGSGFASGGLNAAYMFSQYVGVTTGIHVSAWNWKMKFDHGWQWATFSIQQNYLQVPLGLNIITGKRRGAGLMTQAGVCLNFLTSVEQNYDDSDGEHDNSKDKEGFNRSGVSAYLALGLSIPCSKYVDLHILGRGEQWIKQNFTDATRLTGHLMAFGGRVGVNIRIRTR